MNIELFRAVTPYITLVLALGVAATGWFVRRLVEETQKNFAELKSDLRYRIEKVETQIDKLEAARLADQKYLHENYVSSQVFYLSVGETKALISKIFDELKEVNRMVNQTVGAISIDAE